MYKQSAMSFSRIRDFSREAFLEEIIHKLGFEVWVKKEDKREKLHETSRCKEGPSI